MSVAVRYFNFPTILYRVGHATGSDGLWYNADGRETKLIHTLRAASAAQLPMGPHEVFRADGRRWISAADSLDTLGFWFSYEDMIELIERGYQLEEIGVGRYRHLQFATYSHPVFCMDDMIFKRAIDPMLPYQQFARVA